MSSAILQEGSFADAQEFRFQVAERLGIEFAVQL